MRPLAGSAADQHRPTPANGHRSATLGRLVFHVFAALAEFIRELIVEGTREGLDAARARGQRLGRPPAMTAEQIRQATTCSPCPATASPASPACSASAASPSTSTCPNSRAGTARPRRSRRLVPGSGRGRPSRHRRQPARMPDPAITQHPGALPAHLPGQISSFRFPHRNADAYLRDAMLNGTKLLNTEVGAAIFGASADEPEALLQWFPQALSRQILIAGLQGRVVSLFDGGRSVAPQ